MFFVLTGVDVPDMDGKSVGEIEKYLELPENVEKPEYNLARKCFSDVSRLTYHTKLQYNRPPIVAPDGSEVARPPRVATHGFLMNDILKRAFGVVFW